MNRGVMVLAAVALGAAGAVHDARAEDYTWTGAESATWYDLGNWMIGGRPAEFIPGCDDRAVGADVSLGAGFGTVNVNCSGSLGNVHLGAFDGHSPINIQTTLILDADSTITDLAVDLFGHLRSNAVVTFAGRSGAWTRGIIDGTGSAVNGGHFTIGGAGNRPLRIDLRNDSEIRQTAAMSLEVGMTTAPVITNNAAWFGNAGISPMPSDVPARFVNASGGVIENDEGGGVLRFSVPLDLQGGTVAATGGDIRIERGGIHGGSAVYAADSGHRIIFTVAAGGTPVLMTGTLAAEGFGTIDLQNQVTILVGATLAASMGAIDDDGFLLSVNSALLQVDGTFTNAGRMTWKAGTVAAGEFGTATNESSGTVRIVPGGNGNPTIGADTKFTTRGTWRHERDANIQDGGVLDAVDGATVEMRTGRLLGSGALLVRSSALLLRPFDAPPGNAQCLVPTLVTNGQVIVESGELILAGGSFTDATTSVEPDATLSLTGPFSTSGQVVTSGTGTLGLRTTLTVNNESNCINQMAAPGGFSLGVGASGGTLTGTGHYFNEGLFRWRSGTISVQDTAVDGFTNAGTVITEGANNVLAGPMNTLGVVQADHAIQIQGNGRLTATLGGIVRQTDSTITLGGLFVSARLLPVSAWELLGNASINGAQRFEIVGGTLRKAGGGTSTISAPLFLPKESTAGLVSVESGQLTISTPIVGSGLLSWAIHAGAVVNYNGGVFRTGQNPTGSIIDDLDGVIALAVGPVDPPRLNSPGVENGGRIRPGGPDDAGELVLDAPLFCMPDGILSFNVGGDVPGDTHDRLTVLDAAALDGLLRIRLIDDFIPEVGASFTLLTTAGGITGAFDEVAGDGVWSVAVVGNDLVATLDAAPTCAADLSGADGAVGAPDLAALLGHWGFAPSRPEDLNGDDVVDAADLAALLGAWGNCGG